MWRIYLYDQSGVSAKSKKRAVDESTAPMMNHTSYTVQIYCNKHMVHPSINPLTDILLGGSMWKDEYRVSDPFFIVHCKSCGKKYWSTRRSNAVCSFCHSENVYTETPKHTIVKEGG